MNFMLRCYTQIFWHIKKFGYDRTTISNTSLAILYFDVTRSCRSCRGNYVNLVTMATLKILRHPDKSEITAPFRKVEDRILTHAPELLRYAFVS
jgi:hypothetical protein